MFTLPIILLVILRVKHIASSSEPSISCCRNEAFELFCLRGKCNSTESGIVKVLDDQGAEVSEIGGSANVKSIAEGGLGVFKGFKSLKIGVGILDLTSSSFNGINPSTLTITAKNISKCTFVGLSNLRSLSISGIDDELNLHKDVFSGLEVQELTLREAKMIYSYPTFSNQGGKKAFCEHYLCALRNLSILRIQVEFKCDLTFSGIPSNTSVIPFTFDKYTNTRKDSICASTRHDCHYKKDHRCGRSDLCGDKDPTPIKTSSTLFISLVVLGAALAVVAAAAVLYYYFQATPVPANTSPVAV